MLCQVRKRFPSQLVSFIMIRLSCWSRCVFMAHLDFIVALHLVLKCLIALLWIEGLQCMKRNWMTVFLHAVLNILLSFRALRRKTTFWLYDKNIGGTPWLGMLAPPNDPGTSHQCCHPEFKSSSRWLSPLQYVGRFFSYLKMVIDFQRALLGLVQP